MAIPEFMYEWSKPDLTPEFSEIRHRIPLIMSEAQLTNHILSIANDIQTFVATGRTGHEMFILSLNRFHVFIVSLLLFLISILMWGLQHYFLQVVHSFNLTLDSTSALRQQIYQTTLDINYLSVQYHPVPTSLRIDEHVRELERYIEMDRLEAAYNSSLRNTSDDETV
jgi:hypothetical protein